MQEIRVSLDWRAGSRGSLSWIDTRGLTKQTQPKCYRKGLDIYFYSLIFWLKATCQNCIKKCQNFCQENGKCIARWCCFCQSQTNLDCPTLAEQVGLFSDTITKIKEISRVYYFRSRHTYTAVGLGSMLGFVSGGISLNRSVSSRHTEPGAEM